MSDREPDANAIGEFVRALFAYADDGSFASIRTFYQLEAGKAPPYIVGVEVNGAGLDPVITTAIEAVRRAANHAAPLVFAPPIATFSNPGRAAEDALVNGLCISVELDAGNTARARASLEGLLGPATVVVASGGEWANPATGELFPKLHIHWRLSEPTRTPAEHAALKYARGMACALIGADPSAKTIVHPLRWPGSWHLKGTPRLASTVALNTTAEVHLQDAVAALEEAIEAAGIAQQPPHAATPHGEPEAPLWVVESALDEIPNEDEHWDEWNSRVGLAVYASTAGSPGGLDAWTAWSAKSDKFTPDACAERWAHFRTSPPNRCGFGALHFLATRAGWQRPLSERQHRQRRERDQARAQQQTAGPAPQPQPAQPSHALWGDDAMFAEADILKRRWIVPGYLLRGAVTLLAGPPSGFKSSLMLAWAAAIVLNRPFGRFVPRAHGPVIVYNTEDDAEEQRRRLSAALRQWGAVPADIAGKLVRTGPNQVGTLVERDKKTGGFTYTAVMEGLTDLCRFYKPVAFMADPLAELHVEEENDNVALRAVIAEFRAHAEAQDMATCIVHHTRKGGSASAGDLEAARGASAIGGAVRCAFTLTGMSEADAAQFGMPTGRDERQPYVRLDGAKQNYAPLSSAEWLQKVPVQLLNGETVPAAVPWEPPIPKAASASDLDALAEAIRHGTPTGEPWSPKLSKEPRSVKALLDAHGFHGDAQRVVIGCLVQERGVEAAKFKTTARHKSDGLRVGGQPKAAWVTEDTEE